MASQVNSAKYLIELTPILLKLSKIKKKRNQSGSNASKFILENQHNLDTKNQKCHNKNYRPILNKILENKILEGSSTLIKWDVFQGCKDGSMSAN